jgi:predicted LPLAT superfamily acyltransferase
MSQWDGKSRGNKLGYQIFVWILNTFGVLPAYFILKIVVLYFFFFSPTAFGHLFGLYQKKLGYTSWATIAKIYANYYQLGQSIIDKIVITGAIKNNFTFDFDGEQNLREIVNLNKGGILLSAHIGNWDIAGHLLKRLDTKINIVIFDGEYQQIKQYLEGVAAKKEVSVIVIKNDLSHIYKINEAFKNNELVCMHADRFIEGNKTMQAMFLGEKATFPMGPFLLAATFKVPVSFVFAVKETNFHYHLFASQIKSYAHLKKEPAMQQLLQDYVAAMETKTKKYPTQWFNYFNFWQS